MSFRLIAVGLLLGGVTPLASAQEPALKIKEEKPGLLAKATVTPDSATKVAQARVPTGRIQSGEIEVEDGHLLYSFDVAIPGKSGIEEVQVDAKTGKVLGVEHEGASAEAAEKKADSAKVKP